MLLIGVDVTIELLLLLIKLGIERADDACGVVGGAVIIDTIC